MAGTEITARRARGEGRSRMWRSMRILRQFTIPDLVATAEVTVSSAYTYVEALADGGYVRCARLHRPGRGATHPALWKLVRDTGPYAPRCGKRIADPNLDPARADTHISIPLTEYERALRCVRACAGMADPEREVAALKKRAEGRS